MMRFCSFAAETPLNPEDASSCKEGRLCAGEEGVLTNWLELVVSSGFVYTGAISLSKLVGHKK